MAFSFSEVSAFDALPIENELAFLDIQTEHSRQLHDLRLHTMAIGCLAMSGEQPNDALLRSAIYENHHPDLDTAFGGIVLLADDGQHIGSRSIGRVHVYSRVGPTLLAQPGFSYEQAQGVSAMAQEVRHTARQRGLVLSRNLAGLLRSSAGAPLHNEGPLLRFRIP